VIEFMLEILKWFDTNARVGGGGNSIVPSDDIGVDGNSNP